MTTVKKASQVADLVFDDQTGELLTRVGGGIEVRRAVIDVGNDDVNGNEILPAVSGSKLCVVALCLLAGAEVTVQLYSGSARNGHPVSGPLALAPRGGFILPPPADPQLHWLETDESMALTLQLDVAVAVSGWIVYYEKEI